MAQPDRGTCRRQSVWAWDYWWDESDSRDPDLRFNLSDRSRLLMWAFWQLRLYKNGPIRFFIRIEVFVIRRAHHLWVLCARARSGGHSSRHSLSRSCAEWPHAQCTVWTGVTSPTRHGEWRPLMAKPDARHKWETEAEVGADGASQW